MAEVEDDVLIKEERRTSGSKSRWLDKQFSTVDGALAYKIISLAALVYKMEVYISV